MDSMEGSRTGRLHDFYVFAICFLIVCSALFENSFLAFFICTKKERKYQREDRKMA